MASTNKAHLYDDVLSKYPTGALRIHLYVICTHLLKNTYSETIYLCLDKMQWCCEYEDLHIGYIFWKPRYMKSLYRGIIPIFMI